LTRLIAFLGQRKAFTVLITCVYFSIIVFFHRKVSSIFDWLRDYYSFDAYNDAVRSLSLLLLLLFSAFLFSKLRKGEERFKKSILWISALLIVLFSYHLLITVNIEVIHYVQYALFAVPVFALVRRYGETVLWVTLFGAIDEAYQYFVLYRDNNTVYFDFNDIILNLIGAGIGVLLIYTLTDTRQHVSTLLRPWRGKRFKSPVITVSLTISLCCVLLYSTGLVGSDPGEFSAREFIVLSRQPAPSIPQFWKVPEKGKPYHRLTPAEGMTILILLPAALAAVDFRKSSAWSAERSIF
jgi:VanZ family protein